MGKALSGELSCPCDRSCLSVFSCHLDNSRLDNIQRENVTFIPLSHTHDKLNWSKLFSPLQYFAGNRDSYSCKLKLSNPCTSKTLSIPFGPRERWGCSLVPMLLYAYIPVSNNYSPYCNPTSPYRIESRWQVPEKSKNELMIAKKLNDSFLQLNARISIYSQTG